LLDSFLARVGAIAGGVGLLIVAATVPLGPWLVPVLGLATVLTVGGLLAVGLHAVRPAWKWGHHRVISRGAPNITVAPTGGPSEELRLVVMNHGRKNEFHATGTVVAARNYLNPIRTGSYALLWLGHGTSTSALDTGQSDAILIARFELHDIRYARMGEAHVIECRGSEEARWSGFRWTLEQNEAISEFDIDVTIVGSGLSEQFRRSYTLRPSAWIGPLELIERVPAGMA
jgi:hypothetical protein